MAQDAQSLKEHLNAMRAGGTHVLTQREVTLSAEQCIDMADAISKAPSLTKAVFSFAKIADFQPIGEALAARKDLEEITFSNCTSAEDIAKQMPAILANKPGLSHLVLGSGSFTSPEIIAPLAAAIGGSCPALQHISLPSGFQDNQAASLLLQALAGKEQLETVIISGPNAVNADAVAGDLQQCLQNKQRLTQLHFPTDGPAQQPQTLLDTARTLPNLIAFQFGSEELNAGPIGEWCKHNKQAISTRIAEIAEKRPKEPTPDDIWLVNHRKTAAIPHGLKTKLPHFVRLVERLPALPPALEMDALLAGDANGYCPLDNPKLWEQHPNLLAELAENGQLKEETLARTSPKGANLLEYALGFAKDAGEVFQTLNQNGIYLGKDVFVDDGQPTLALQTLLEKSQGAALLNNENWRGRKPELQATLAAIPDADKARLAGRHAFMAAFGQQEQSCARSI